MDRVHLLMSLLWSPPVPFHGQSSPADESPLVTSCTFSHTSVSQY
uniref:Uncharacterized protein n=1 Tax=Anguilla anguilla TaxID=7936 RepID=A0A0E9UG03_ANGAN